MNVGIYFCVLAICEYNLHLVRSADGLAAGDVWFWPPGNPGEDRAQ